MTEARKPNCSKALSSKKIDDQTRNALGLPEYLFLAEYGGWSIENIMNDYFLFVDTPHTTGHFLYNEAIEALQVYSESRDLGTKAEKTFAKKFLAYINRPQIKKSFLKLYQKRERANRLNESAIEMNEEIEITSNELFSEELRSKGQKRKCEGLDDEEKRIPLEVNVKSKNYNIQSPSTIIPLNSPVIEEYNFSKIATRVDICLGSNTTYATEATLQEFRKLQTDHRKNKNLLAIESSFGLFEKFMAIGKEHALQHVAALDCGDDKFNQFMKYSLIDFTINSMRITPIPTNDERTMYVEHIVPIIKYFSNITGLMSFTWCERKDKESASSIFFVTQEKSSTTLLDGIGINNKKFPCMVIESSGLKVTTDINHLLEDSIKNVKSATDALKNIMCRFPNASMNTVKLANVYSIHIIQTKMTLIKYSLKDKDTFKAIECSSALIPCSFEERIYLTSVYDIFAYLYKDLANQVKIFEKLEAEQLGLTDVADEEMICFTNVF